MLNGDDLNGQRETFDRQIGFHQPGESNSCLRRFCFTKLCDWFKIITRFSSNQKENEESHTSFRLFICAKLIISVALSTSS